MVLYSLAMLILLILYAHMRIKTKTVTFLTARRQLFEFLDHGRWEHPFVYGSTLTFDAVHRRVYVVDLTQKYPLHFFKKGTSFHRRCPGRFYPWGADARRA